MANRIKGITVEIGGDTTKLQNAIKGFTLKYYRWLDEDGSEIDVDNLPGTVVWESEELPILDEQGHEIPLHFIKAETYTLRPELLDDDIIDDALPKYADYDTVLYVYADVEYKTEAESIIYDGKVKSSDLPVVPPVIPTEPEPYIRDSIDFHFSEYLRIKNVPYYFLTTFHVHDFPGYSYLLHKL